MDPSVAALCTKALSKKLIRTMVIKGEKSGESGRQNAALPNFSVEGESLPFQNGLTVFYNGFDQVNSNIIRLEYKNQRLNLFIPHPCLL